MSRADEFCSHGRPFYSATASCIECEIVWHEEMLAHAKENVRHHERLLEIATNLRDYMLRASPTKQEGMADASKKLLRRDAAPHKPGL